MTTIRNSGLIEELSTDLLPRNDILNRLGNVVSTFQNIPGLTGLWPMSTVQRSTGAARDLSGNGKDLTYNGNPTYNYYNQLIPYIDLDGTGDFLSRADETDLDITGTEGGFAASVRGLTLGGWFYVTAGDSLISKWLPTGNQRSYLLNPSGLSVSTDGTAIVSATASTPTGEWFFIAGRFIPSTEMATFVGQASGYVKTTNVVGVPASIFNSTAVFVVGGRSGGVNLLTGRASICFLSANQLSDVLIFSLFEQTRVLFDI